MRNILFILMTLFFTRISRAAVDIETVYAHGYQAKKVFEIKWDEPTQTGQVSFGLAYTNFDPKVHGNGFDLWSAASSQLIDPAPPAGCKISVTGTFFFSPDTNQVNPMSLIFDGAPCRETIEKIVSSRSLSLKFTRVAFLVDPTQRADLNLKITDAPANVCGLTGTLHDRLADCEIKNPELNTRSITSYDTYGVARSSLWKMATFTEAFEGAWEDLQTGLTWSLKNPQPLTADAAEALCAQKGQALPTLEDFVVADSHGSTTIFADHDDYWAVGNGVMVTYPSHATDASAPRSVRCVDRTARQI